MSVFTLLSAYQGTEDGDTLGKGALDSFPPYQGLHESYAYSSSFNNTIQWRYDTQAIHLYFRLKINMLINVIHISPRNDQKLP